MTRAQLVARASLLVGVAADDTQNTAERDLLRDLANEAVVDVLTRTRVNVQQVELTLTAGTRDYEIGAQILKLHDLTNGDDERMLEVPSSDFSLTGDYGYAVTGYNHISLSWEPDAGASLTAWYTPRPTAMSDDANDPSAETYGAIPVEFHRALVHYMAWHMAAVAKDESSGFGERYRILYEGQDGMGGYGSDLGRIKHATNARARGGKRAAARNAIPGAGVHSSSYWRG